MSAFNEMGYHYTRLPGDAVPTPGVPMYSGPAPSYNFDNEMMSAKYLSDVEANKKGYFRGTPDMYLRNPVADIKYWNRPGNITDRSPCDDTTLKTRNITMASCAILGLFVIMIYFTK